MGMKPGSGNVSLVIIACIGVLMISSFAAVGIRSRLWSVRDSGRRG
ncbi:unnamed protein product [Linum tenue]|uniref:Uncharacterized protein n=1 Tax=Linum tenue TaxID=586396 RepID=A0AAV0LNY6_9ROSI|nr:unnamed protein product [Linum tenue]